ncbi:MAG: response regulator transcription factor [Saprospiraceae bacterium]|nr:response regulator transcription factor [Saprospiraceae bacterium]HMW38228.1 response regulator transcription factor [Saprospiraceae bacterium]HMX87423.1 response regulator transcription factor [Saprospiraceae bacterium]HMZ39250.1 response regulator transcription factor [Saprospiraceae bacterium]HNA65161.1 response regulator transcription factor [Saprospiraceae bacterium]
MSENQSIKILLVEDDRNFGDVLRSYLEMHNYEVDLAVDGIDGFEKFRRSPYDLCILDVMMPRKDGFTLAKDIRSKNNDIPIIFLTAKTLKEDVVEGFKIGADDYVTKPFNSEELLYRVQAILKRSHKSAEEQQNEQEEYSVGKFIFNYPLRVLYLRQQDQISNKVKLSPKEAMLLKLFCEHRNKVLLRSEALTKIWGEDNYFTARSMDVFITKIRKYLADDPDIEISNIHGNGFRMIIRGEAGSEL